MSKIKMSDLEKNNVKFDYEICKDLARSLARKFPTGNIPEREVDLAIVNYNVDHIANSLDMKEAWSEISGTLSNMGRKIAIKIESDNILERKVREIVQYFDKNPKLDTGKSNIWTVGTYMSWWDNTGLVEKNKIINDVMRVLMVRKYR